MSTAAFKKNMDTKAGNKPYRPKLLGPFVAITVVFVGLIAWMRDRRS